MAERRYDAITKGAAVEMLSTEDLTREALAFEEFDQLCEAIARARIEAHRIYSAKLRGRYDEIAPRDTLFRRHGICRDASFARHTTRTVQPFNRLSHREISRSEASRMGA